MRRATRDIQFGRALRMGQHWLRVADETVWTVRQIHRADCSAVLERRGVRVTVPFRAMREGWAIVQRLEDAA